MQAETFDNWSDAYDACRMRDKPMRAEVGGETLTIYPSGGYATPCRVCGQTVTAGTASATDEHTHRDCHIGLSESGIA